jgi:hypothetical protein
LAARETEQNRDMKAIVQDGHDSSDVRAFEEVAKQAIKAVITVAWKRQEEQNGNRFDQPPGW